MCESNQRLFCRTINDEIDSVSDNALIDRRAIIRRQNENNMRLKSKVVKAALIVRRKVIDFIADNIRSRSGVSMQ